METNDLSKLNDRHQFEVFKGENFTGKTIQKIKFNNIHFIECDFTDTLITSCEFNQECLFKKCKFNGTSLLNVKFNESIISECTFEKNVFNDVIIDSNSKFEKNEFIGEDFKVNNFWLRGEKIEEISKLISIVEVVEEQVGDPLKANRSMGEIDESGELLSRQDPTIDAKLYNALFPEILKLYPALERKEDGDYGLFVDGIEFAFCRDDEYNGWRYIFFVRDTDDSLGSDIVTVSTDKEITFDTLKQAFEDQVKGEAKLVADRTNSEVIKSSLKKFTELVFKDASVITEDVNVSAMIFVTSDNPADIIGDFNCGYDNESGELVTIIGQPFESNDTVLAQKMKDLVIKFVNGTIRDDYIGGNFETSVQQTYSIENQYSVYVIKQNPICTNAYLMPFNKQHVVVIKK